MIVRTVLITAIMGGLLVACGEPRRTPDGHLMDRPKMSAYGPDDVTRHDMEAEDDGESAHD